MDLELNEAGMTFLVGALTILSIVALLYAFTGRTIIPAAKKDDAPPLPSEGPPAALLTGMFIGLSFALGLLIEDAAYKFHDPFLYRPLNLWRDVFGRSTNRGDLKAEIARGVLFRTIPETRPERKSLGDDVCRGDLFRAALQPLDSPVAAWACDGLPLPGVRGEEARYRAVDGAVMAAFYFAKNRVYREPNYFNELRRIQSRLEFSRTVATLTFGAAAVALAALLYAALTFRREGARRRVIAAAVALAVFMGVHALAYLAYVQESEEFQKRVFGYYASMLRAEKFRLP